MTRAASRRPQGIAWARSTLASMRALTWLWGFVVGAVLGVGLVIGYDTWEDMRTPDVVEEECRLDGSDTGWCVQRRQLAPGLFRPEVDQLYIIRRVDGDDIPRVTFVEYPFQGDGLDVSFEDGRIVVHGNNGARLVLPEAFYEPG